MAEPLAAFGGTSSPKAKRFRFGGLSEAGFDAFLDLDEKRMSPHSAATLLPSGPGYEVTSSTSDGEILNGGDSGFQELTESGQSPRSVSCSGSDSGPGSVSAPTASPSSASPITPRPEPLELEDGDGDPEGELRRFSANPEASASPAFRDSGLESMASGEPLEQTESTKRKRDADGDEVDSDAGSEVSDISCLSDISGENWKPVTGPINWVQQQINGGTSPRDILRELLPNTPIAPHLDNLTLWRLIVSMLSEPPQRKKLRDVNALEDVVELIRKSRRVLVLTGAGVSVSCGIPDFRSRDGIYARLSKDFPDLPDPQAMFDIHYFRRDPRPFFKFAKEIYPGQFEPSPSHKFIKLLEEHKKLLRNYSQNIDTLEQTAGIKGVITCHGSFATASCTRCKHRVEAAVIKEDIFSQTIPRCPVCPQDTEMTAVMKPDIVFFGEGLSDEFHEAMTVDKDVCDLLIVMGSSLKVRPVALIPSSIPSHVPQILINREPLNHLTFDVELLGDCDFIVQEICNRLGEGWNSICKSKEMLSEIRELAPHPIKETQSLEVNNNADVSDSIPSSSERLEACSSTSEKEVTAPGNSRLEVSQPDSTNFDFNDEPESSQGWFERRTSVADRLPDGSFLYVAPNRYVFKGAEVYESNLRPCSDESEDDSSSDSSSTSHKSDPSSPRKQSPGDESRSNSGSCSTSSSTSSSPSSSPSSKVSSSPSSSSEPPSVSRSNPSPTGSET